MGTLRTYKCNKCDYKAKISGGADVGVLVKTNTMICKRCKRLVDVVAEYLTSKIPVVSDLGKCPECYSSKHLVKCDEEKQPCPRCDGKMEIDNEETIVVWD